MLIRAGVGWSTEWVKGARSTGRDGSWGQMDWTEGGGEARNPMKPVRGYSHCSECAQRLPVWETSRTEGAASRLIGAVQCSAAGECHGHGN